ncbi:Alpha/beta hydrolase [Flavobacterium longum]|uniref:alpha/beta fold hydrolase n=1 Tax=Flavobacterium longum TaxID=1299340 RepID=UPI0039EBE10F
MKNLLLLHGAVGSSRQLEGLAKALSSEYTVHTLNFSGHGGRELPEVFSIETFADDVLSFLDAEGLTSVFIFGYSMGGYVALFLARHHPEKVSSVFTLATKFEWSPDIAQREAKMLDPEKIQEKVPAFASALKARHQPISWEQVLSRTAAMMLSMGARNPLSTPDFSAIMQPVRLAVGDNDTMVSIAETTAVCRQLPCASLAVLPNVQHPIEKIVIADLAREVDLFFRNP